MARLGLFRQLRPSEEFRTKMLIMRQDREIRHLSRKVKTLENKIRKLSGVAGKLCRD